MTSSRRVVFAYDEADGAWLVDFPDEPGCHTFGATLDEARANACEALQVWLDTDDVAVDEVIRPAAAAG
jgi:predicted RNase H-like HicB family nuclease